MICFDGQDILRPGDVGIQKICELCRELGTPDPEYTVRGDDITVKFFALESAKISNSKNPKHQSDVLDFWNLIGF